MSKRFSIQTEPQGNPERGLQQGRQIILKPQGPTPVWLISVWQRMQPLSCWACKRDPKR